MNKTIEQTDQEVRRLVGLYVEGAMDSEEFSVRVRGLLRAAGLRQRRDELSVPAPLNGADQ